LPNDFEKVKKGANFVEDEPEFDLSYVHAITPEYYQNYASDDGGRDKTNNSKFEVDPIESSVISSDSSLHSKFEQIGRDKMTHEERSRYDKEQFLK